MERLDKLVAKHTNLSRSGARQLIRKGAVCVNGEKIFACDKQLDINNDELKINDEIIVMRKYLYIMLHKPQGILSAAKDPDCPTVIDILPENLKRRGLFPAGRLDKDTTGLLVITDDGDFSHRLISPSHHVYKTYIAELEGKITEAELDKLRAGITLGDGTECLPAKVRIIDDECKKVEVKIREGKYHQVKRMFASVNNSVAHLHREAIGALTLDPELKEGDARLMTQEEIEKIFTETEL